MYIQVGLLGNQSSTFWGVMPTRDASNLRVYRDLYSNDNVVL